MCVYMCISFLCVTFRQFAMYCVLVLVILEVDICLIIVH